VTERRVVVTGIGMVTPLGIGAETTWKALLAGGNGVAPIRRFDPAGFPVRFAAEAPLPGSGASLKAALTELALGEALRMSGVQGGPRLGVCIGSEAARPPLEWLHGGPVDPAEVTALAPDAPTRQAARMAGAEGPRSTVSTACTSSSQAIGEAALRIRRGEVDAMIAGGVDALSEPLMVVGFAKLGALSTRNDDHLHASRPFDRDRDGFVLGEGAGFLVLEEESIARKRGAPILARIDGWGCSCNAWRITDSPPDGRGAAQAMAAALRDAGLSAEDIGYINAHGTSTPQNDLSESRAIRTVFGPPRVPVSSTKGHTGHLVAACGAVEAIFCVQSLRDGVLPPTRNVENVDPECDVNVLVGDPREARFRYALTNAFGFGGSNGSIVLGAP
jgi:3-oxoacyl-[acyl-carrier-protein] synthase II